MKHYTTPKPSQQWKAQRRDGAYRWTVSRGKLSTPYRKANQNSRRIAYGKR